MPATVSQLRQQYKPDQVSMLFIAESPPESSEKEVRFFYNPNQEKLDFMYRAVMAAVFPDFSYRPGEKGLWLQRFKERGCFMIDATDRPVNHLTPQERLNELNTALPEKLKEIGELIERCTPIILIKRNIFDLFNEPLRQRGYNVIHEEFLPFPSHGHQRRFSEACSAHLLPWMNIQSRA